MKTRVLFLCVHDSARSQMAEGLLRKFAGDRFDVLSAGLEARTLRPEAVEALREIGIDISHHRSKSVDELARMTFDIVVTTCDEAKEARPLLPGAKRMLHWSVPDPATVEGSAAERAAAFRHARELLSESMHEVIQAL